MQKLIEERRKTKKSKLPENYRGLGSTIGLEDLEKFKNKSLNTELQGGIGQRKVFYILLNLTKRNLFLKEIYLTWLLQKEREISEKQKIKKIEEKEKRKAEDEERREKLAGKELAYKSWQEKKIELAKVSHSLQFF